MSPPSYVILHLIPSGTQTHVPCTILKSRSTRSLFPFIDNVASYNFMSPAKTDCCIPWRRTCTQHTFAYSGGVSSMELFLHKFSPTCTIGKFKAADGHGLQVAPESGEPTDHLASRVTAADLPWSWTAPHQPSRGRQRSSPTLMYPAWDACERACSDLR
jgi:hypothetical protein